MSTQKLLAIFTRTPLHVGAGTSVGAIDNPIIRERHTHFPMIPGSTIKGVLADQWNDDNCQRTPEGEIIFGKTDSEHAAAGVISFGEAKILAFPVRSAKGCFAFVTSPLCLERFKRDFNLKELDVPKVQKDMTCMAGTAVTGEQNAVVLEEYRFDCVETFPKAWADKLISLLSEDPILSGSVDRFVLLSDADMSYFVENACIVSQHVAIDSSTGTAKKGALFNQEEVPSETLFYAPLTYFPRTRGDKQQQEKEAVDQLFSKYGEETLVQFGAKGTMGIGYCSVKLVK